MLWMLCRLQRLQAALSCNTLVSIKEEYAVLWRR